MSALSLVIVFFATEASAFSYSQLRNGLNTSIEEFYNTTDPVWTYESMVDETASFSCLVDVTANTTRSYLYFRRYFYSDGKRLTTPLMRVLDPAHPMKSRTTLVYDGAEPIYKQTNPQFQETLLYQSNDSSCGVFQYFKHPDVFRYDLRLWNCSLEAGPEEDCVKFFNEVYQVHTTTPPFRTLQKRKIYNHTCQDILKPPGQC
uniref:Lipocalin/cytosolic fatty-acid binding domain-containing protein n=1 Tax=Amblyomma maculatum TaxID=34609 RepID=G3MQI5_AMBMU